MADTTPPVITAPATVTATSGNRITLTDQADGYVIADAVKLTPVGAAPNSATWNPVVTTAGVSRPTVRKGNGG